MLADSEDEIELQRTKMISDIKRINYGVNNSNVILLIEFKVV